VVHQDPEDTPTFSLCGINKFIGVPKKTKWGFFCSFSVLDNDQGDAFQESDKNGLSFQVYNNQNILKMVFAITRLFLKNIGGRLRYDIMIWMLKLIDIQDVKE
jgi:hypothetical protein